MRIISVAGHLSSVNVTEANHKKGDDKDDGEYGEKEEFGNSGHTDCSGQEYEKKRCEPAVFGKSSECVHVMISTSSTLGWPQVD